MEKNKKNKICIQVVYASAKQEKIINVEIAQGSTLQDAIEASGILHHFPEIDLSAQKIGVFSKIKKLQDEVKDGDRIEIYRPLLINPKEARRLRVKNSDKNKRAKNI